MEHQTQVTQANHTNASNQPTDRLINRSIKRAQSATNQSTNRPSNAASYARTVCAVTQLINPYRA
eukprot:895967-Lingulodinium_polyedra.AAC.1